MLWHRFAESRLVCNHNKIYADKVFREVLAPDDVSVVSAVVIGPFAHVIRSGSFYDQS